MINKYKDFILEKMILESLISFSNDFKNLLLSIDDSVSKSLLSIENNDIETQNNFFDIVKDDKEQISFIPDRRASNFINDAQAQKRGRFTSADNAGILKNSEANGRIFQSLGFEPPIEGSLYKPNSTDYGNIISEYTSEKTGNVYFLMDYDGNKTVINSNRIEIEDPFKTVWNLNSQKIRIGRGIRALLRSANIDHTDKEIEDFVNKFKSEHDKLNDAFSNFELVDGEDIGYWYNSKRYYAMSGQLGNSCMASVSKSFFQIYMENDCCKLLILKNKDNKDLIMGRALIWTTKVPEGITFMDRIYCVYDSDVELFREYSRSKGWYYKRDNSNGNYTQMVGPNLEIIDEGEITVSITKGKYYDNYPYLDTLKGFDPAKGILSTKKGAYNLESTDGELEDSYCDTCDGEGTITCHECDGDGEAPCDDCDGGHIHCDVCDGQGELECGSCDGEGELECDVCDGEGKNEDGEDCEDCEGNGKISCDDCEGNGNISCDDCDGEGELDCDECNGSGSVSCDNCYGDGSYECAYC